MIYLNITKLKNINAFLYEGLDRYTATKPVNLNKQLEIGVDYSVPYKNGMLLIVYPQKDAETEVEFTYV